MNSTEKFIGIIQLDTRFPRIPGDIGNEKSYDFPVRIKIVDGATIERAEVKGDPTLLVPFTKAAQELEAAGACAITTSCGFLAPFQKEIAQAVKIPVFLSALLQIPLAFMMTQRRVGILTANGEVLKERHLREAGVPEHIPISIIGLHDKPGFAGSILSDAETIDPKLIEAEVVEAAEALLADYPDIGAFVFECHNLAPYAPAMSKAIPLPIFDIISFTHWVYSTIVKRKF